MTRTVILLIAVVCAALATTLFAVALAAPVPGEGTAGALVPATTVPARATSVAHSERQLHTPYAAAPACADHGPRAYHGLWDEQRGCHYNHTHGDDPREVDDVFGLDFYRWAGGEVSYPWQTPAENLHKHGAYIWLVRRDLPCTTSAQNGANGSCISDFRAQLHGVGAAQGAVTNFHSAWLEARVCGGDPWRCGIVRVGGWQGPVNLLVDRSVALKREGSNNHFFQHYFDTGNRAFGTWYTGAASGLYSVVPQFEDMWNTVPPGASAEEIVAAAQWFCAGADGELRYHDCAANSSRVQPHIIRFNLPRRIAARLAPGDDGLVDFQGYVDRFGELRPGCHAPGPNCIPFVLQNVPRTRGEFQYRGQAREYDICFGDDGSADDGSAIQDCRQGRPSGWIEYPIH